MEGIRTPDVVKNVTLSLDTNAYADGDVLADTQEITDVFPNEDTEAILYSVSILDQDDNGRALDLVFLETDTSLGTENSAVSISAENARNIVTVVPVSAGDYNDLVNSQIAIKGPADTGMSTLIRPRHSDETSLYVGAVYRDGTGDTYTASGIKLKIGLIRG